MAARSAWVTTSLPHLDQPGPVQPHLLEPVAFVCIVFHADAAWRLVGKDHPGLIAGHTHDCSGLVAEFDARGSVHGSLATAALIDSHLDISEWKFSRSIFVTANECV